MTTTQAVAFTATLLAFSNLFMTFAWYGPPEAPPGEPVVVAALASWGIALFEYLLQVPANRAGFGAGLSLAQLKILQEVITLAVFVPFAMLYMARGSSGTTCGRGCAWWVRCISFSLVRTGSPPPRG
jgi:uncharacterized protein (DUF486 family)